MLGKIQIVVIIINNYVSAKLNFLQRFRRDDTDAPIVSVNTLPKQVSIQKYLAYTILK